MARIEIRHWAYNIKTGEIIGCSKTNGLKKRVAYVNSFNYRNGYPYGGWRFFNGSEEDFRNWRFSLYERG